MATYKVRGNSHNIIYSYRTAEGESKQQWETYVTELEALQRKTYGTADLITICTTEKSWYNKGNK